jgi:uncharacterized protein (TIGR02246 family)
MRWFLGATCLLVAAVAPAAADTTMQCKATTEAEIAGLFDRWNASLATLKPEDVVKNYEEDAILLPTVSNTPRLTQAERLDYFEHFLANKPVGKIDMRIIKIGCDDAVDSGLYTFTFANGQQVHARYTFTYELKDGRWLISSHHSSAMPEAAK